MFKNFYKNRSFLISFAVVFLGISLTKLGVRVPNIALPVQNAITKSKINFFEIKNKPRTYNLTVKEILSIFALPFFKEQKHDKKDFVVRGKLETKKNFFKIYQSNDLGKQNNISADKAFSYMVLDLDTGTVLAQKNSSEKLPIASLTKLMTAVVALDLANPNDVFEVSINAANQIPTKIGVVAGQKMTLEELLHASLLTSANDAVQVIKEGIDKKYNGEVFVSAMNQKARFLGLSNSSFANPQGLDNPNNYSSASDLSVLTGYALSNYPLIKEIVKKDYKYLPANENHKVFDLYNWNGLLGVYPNIFGVKIGNTQKAETTTIVAAQRKGKNILTVLLGAPNVLDRDLWASDLLDLGFEKVLNLPPVLVNENQLRAKYNTWQYWN